MNNVHTKLCPKKQYKSIKHKWYTLDSLQYYKIYSQHFLLTLNLICIVIKYINTVYYYLNVSF